MERLERNIERLRERLKRETNQQERWALQRLLFQQMYKIGFSSKLIDCIVREIEEWKGWIERQQSRVQRFERFGRETKQEKRLLVLAQHTLAVHELHRRRMLLIVTTRISSDRSALRSGKRARRARAPAGTGKRHKDRS